MVVRWTSTEEGCLLLEFGSFSSERSNTDFCFDETD